MAQNIPPEMDNEIEQVLKQHRHADQPKGPRKAKGVRTAAA
jgi:hypothetical protein